MTLFEYVEPFGPFAWAVVPSRPIRRALALAAVILIVASPVLADDILRDDRGRRVGTITEGIGDRLIIRDARGRRTGTIEPGIGGRQIIRDDRGRRVGTIEPKN